MFELIQSMNINVELGNASAEAFVPADHPLFADHFPGSPLLPGSLMIELAAQVSGPVAEEFAKVRMETERWAVLGMVRDVRFLHPVFLPANLWIYASVYRSEPSRIETYVTLEGNGERAMQGSIVMMMIETSAELAQAIEARNSRLARWKAS